VRIRPAALDAIVAHARSASPRECCGLLIGAANAVLEAAPAGNIADGVSRFLIDPVDHINGRREARQRGLEVLGFYHSHPRSPARPSETDVSEAAYPDAVHLIVSLAGEEPEWRLFRIGNGTAVELALTPES
jgi:proteasome lid subunit RPN8/RPN11